MIQCKFYPPAEFKAREDERRAAIDAWQAAHPGVTGWPPELYAVNDAFFPPGSMWFCPWWHDPQDPEDLARIEPAIAALRAGKKNGFLNIHYLTTWARIRPPISIVCPGGGHWCPDQGSSNGDGWTVTGDPPNLSVTPSIWVDQGKGKPREYHGWLGTNGAPPGWFSNPL